MKKILLSTTILIGLVSGAQAHVHHHHHTYRVHNMGEGIAIGLVHMLHSIQTVNTDAGPITVATSVANNFRGLIHDFVSAGYKPEHVSCFARGGHVHNSRHYLGEACDFDQSGWGRTRHFMYTQEAALIIDKWGFTNGCSFKDCGHVGTDGQRR